VGRERRADEISRNREVADLVMRKRRGTNRSTLAQGVRRGAGSRGDRQTRVPVWRYENTKSPWLHGFATQPSVSPAELISLPGS
jgi:hypothetical protein